jgi:hypothetical protein
MATKCVTLPIKEALALAGMQNHGILPHVIKLGETALVLSEKQDCYFTTTASDCSCIQFASGIQPCSHQVTFFEDELMLRKNQEEQLKKKKQEERRERDEKWEKERKRIKCNEKMCFVEDHEYYRELYG